MRAMVAPVIASNWSVFSDCFRRRCSLHRPWRFESDSVVFLSILPVHAKL